MGIACRACGGVGWGELDPAMGYRATGEACPSCNPEGNGKPPEPPRPLVNRTHQFVDGPPDHPVDPNDSGQGPEAFFTGDQISAQRAADAAREAGMGRDG